MLLAEDDLVDDYLAGALPEAHGRAFEQRLQERPELLARVSARRTLGDAMQRHGGRPAVPARGSRRAAWGLLGLAAAAAVAVAIRTPPRSEIAGPAASPTTVATTAARPRETTVIVLLAAGVRGTAVAPTAVLRAETTTVRLRRAVAPGAPSAVPVIVEDVDAHRVWSGSARRVDATLEAEVPATVLHAGDYIARFGDDETFFRVQQR